MGLMDKFKNLFTDEEIIDDDDLEDTIKIKQIKNEEEEKTKEHKLPTFMREKIAKEEKDKLKEQKENKDDILKENDVVLNNFEDKEEDKGINLFAIEDTDNKENEVKEKPFKFPVFDDSDFVEPSRSSRHIKKVEEEDINASKPKNNVSVMEFEKDKKEKPKVETKVSKLYKDKREPEKKFPKFQTSPIISPVFGVLEKNYLPDDVTTNDEDNYEINRHSKTVDFDSVRKKAYGTTIEDDIRENLDCKNCEYLKKAKSCKKKDNDKDNLMYDALCEKEDSNDITVEEASENYFDYGEEYKKNTVIDPIYLDIDNDKEEEVKVINNVSEKENTKKKKNAVPPVKSSINLLSTLKKSNGEEGLINDDNNNNNSRGNNSKKSKEKELELTDDLFNLIDSMYEERDD